MKNPDNFFMKLAMDLSTKSKCSRLPVGAVMTSYNDHILVTGYNESPSGSLHCKDINPQKKTPCICIHAEQNCIARSSENWRTEKKLYTTTFPCYACSKLLVSVNVVEVWFMNEYRKDMRISLSMFNMSDCKVFHFKTKKELTRRLKSLKF